MADEDIWLWGGNLIIVFRPCWCPPPFPSPSIYRCFPFTLLHLPLNFIRASSLQLMYPHPPADPSLTHFFRIVGFGLALPLWYPMLWSQRRTCMRCALSRNLVSNFCPGRVLNLGPCSLMTANVTARLRRTQYLTCIVLYCIYTFI